MAVTGADVEARKRKRGVNKTRRRLLVRALITGLYIMIFVLAPLIAPRSATKVSIRDMTQPPGSVLRDGTVALLGTDQVGRDMLSRILFGGRVSLLIAFSAVVVACIMGSVLGLVAGYYGGRLDDVIMRIGDIQLAFPAILLALAITAAIGPSIPNLILTLGITRWVAYARLIRGGVLSAREEEYVLSAVLSGARGRRIMFKHVLPNVMTPAIILAALHVGQMIIAESALSFLGLGIQPPMPSLGSMVSDGRDYLNTAWWISTFSGLVIALTVMLVGYLGDAVRDALDPRFREY